MDKKTLVAAVLAAVAVAPAFADKGGHHGKGHGRGHDDHHAYVDRHDDWRGGCPPGLAKKHNGCLPPGQAKKMDRHHGLVGHRAPAGTVYVVPRHVRATLPPPPYGYRYAVVNNQVVLVSDANIVVDIVRSLLG
ncbi:RcnB family protein [Ramlibacter sp. USB13]|uniref:RcnB family protein n=1 Tax=Ramlibacter cellulosilyticus TaxID=2764187 RepID=A0A923MXX1_9BURK|nr:RcnB family protein [Ramlibacter cellulosilyticus]MBC5786154.1 RcnB family protein [Ramlibacter cellulosilyticus]